MNGRVAKLIRKMAYGGVAPAEERVSRQYVGYQDRSSMGAQISRVMCTDPRAIYRALKTAYKGAREGRARHEMRAEARKAIVFNRKNGMGRVGEVPERVATLLGHDITMSPPQVDTRVHSAPVVEAVERRGVPRHQAEGGEGDCDGNTGACGVEESSEPCCDGVAVDRCEPDCRCGEPEGGEQADTVADAGGRREINPGFPSVVEESDSLHD